MAVRKSLLQRKTRPRFIYLYEEWNKGEWISEKKERKNFREMILVTHIAMLYWPWNESEKTLTEVIWKYVMQSWFR